MRHAQAIPICARKSKPCFRPHDEEEARGQEAGASPHVVLAWKTHGRCSAPTGRRPVVEGYEVLGRIGIGGMGAVYEASSFSPRDGWRSRSCGRRWRRERDAAASSARSRRSRDSNTGNIAQILSAGVCASTAGPSPYLVLELVDGEPIDLVAQRLVRRDRIKLILQMCAAVAHAHQRGIIHRDLKPSNVLVTSEGQVKVLDFGLAIMADAAEADAMRQTRTGHLVGTLAYMSPEQATGNSEGLDTRSDVYGLGVLAYEILTGRLPYELGNLPLQKSLRVLLERAPDPTPELPTDLQVILGKALAKEPRQALRGRVCAG